MSVPTLFSVAIEINSECNRKCSWCPNFDNKKPVEFLDEKIFFNIIDQLKAMDFTGKITFNHYNEPLLDKRILDFFSYIKNIIPHTFIYINTNGDMLNLSLWKKLRKAGLDYANVSQYDGKINDNILRILEKLNSNEKKHFRASVFHENHICNRAGLIQSKRNLKEAQKNCCDRPFYQLCINYKGKAVLCCNDYYGLIEIGDVTKTSIKELWESDILNYYRGQLPKGRSNLKLCNKCDML